MRSIAKERARRIQTLHGITHINREDARAIAHRISLHDFKSCNTTEVKLMTIGKATDCARCKRRAEIPTYTKIYYKYAQCTSCKQIKNNIRECGECDVCVKSLEAIKRVHLKMIGYPKGAAFLLCCTRCKNCVDRTFASKPMDITRDMVEPKRFAVHGTGAWNSELLPNIVSESAAGGMAIFRSFIARCPVCS